MALLESQLSSPNNLMLENTALPPGSKVCIISARRYGDAIIHASIAHLASQSRPDLEWIIWTKPEFIPLFQLMGFSQIVTSEFPIAGGAANFVKSFGFGCLKAIIQIRKLKLNASIDFIGDTREAFLGALISGASHHSPSWHPSHWMYSLIWKIKIPNVIYLNISKTQDHVYGVITQLLENLIGIIPPVSYQLAPIRKPITMAIHPFSSQEFKSWPKENWQKICSLLNQKSITPLVLCSLQEKAKADELFASDQLKMSITATYSIEELIIKLKSIDLLIGVDSFLVHLAAVLGKRTVVINAGNLPIWWQAPNSISLAQSGDCSYYPCANNPRCLGSAHESQCIKSITPNQVMNAIEKALSSQ